MMKKSSRIDLIYFMLFRLCKYAILKLALKIFIDFFQILVLFFMSKI